MYIYTYMYIYFKHVYKHIYIYIYIVFKHVYIYNTGEVFLNITQLMYMSF